ncbi:uncharacterized protein K452DRAFT_288318 [Aplosporella prunicola CBS 121167]|uniref:Uncharacterized protein n=1 Tax=Aplosporella prunicola CBS 121167 TaxID=1176127 RepID=A0A6A6B9F8_9PEZI|nr:uncharacterized protein K452DRAFT_288318 [Aplosporella prunicola CBS 121167]KAF2140912.1 hypothetical protein K452DRAFT_288318 [Aplosporella prunicola CBS 121167]
MKFQALFSRLSISFSYFSSNALNITITRPNDPFIVGHPLSHAQSDADEIVRLFNNLGRTTTWKLIEKIPFEGDTYEPEGIVRLGPERYIVSAGEYTAPTIKYNQTTNGTDRSAGAGFAHLLVFNNQGQRIADATLTRRGDIEYHIGGLDWDGQALWATLAQYRPNTTAAVVRVDQGMEPTTVLRARDHLGGIVHDVEGQRVTALNWGGRNATTWTLLDGAALPVGPETPRPPSDDALWAAPVSTVRNPSFFVDYQDCKFLGRTAYYQHRTTVMLCGGVATVGSGDRSYNLGGLALVDAATMAPLAEVPVTMTSDKGVPLTQNPVDVAVVDGQLRAYFLPDQRNSTLYVYEAQADSPYQY